MTAPACLYARPASAHRAPSFPKKLTAHQQTKLKRATSLFLYTLALACRRRAGGRWGHTRAARRTRTAPWSRRTSSARACCRPTPTSACSRPACCGGGPRALSALYLECARMAVISYRLPPAIFRVLCVPRHRPLCAASPQGNHHGIGRGSAGSVRGSADGAALRWAVCKRLRLAIC